MLLLALLLEYKLSFNGSLGGVLSCRVLKSFDNTADKYLVSLTRKYINEIPNVNATRMNTYTLLDDPVDFCICSLFKLRVGKEKVHVLCE